MFAVVAQLLSVGLLALVARLVAVLRIVTAHSQQLQRTSCTTKQYLRPTMAKPKHPTKYPKLIPWWISHHRQKTEVGNRFSWWRAGV